jgi:hypothetical protein
MIYAFTKAGGQPRQTRRAPAAKVVSILHAQGVKLGRPKIDSVTERKVRKLLANRALGT